MKVQLVGVSYDSVEILKKFSDKQRVTFPLLSDQGSEVIKAFGLHNKKGLPHPGTIIVDSNGVIRAKLFHKGYAKRHTPDDLRKAASELQ